jgi:fatty-acyl-CoA synthase
VALINTGLVGRSLAHCIDVAHADHIILAAECVDAFETARPHLDRVPPTWSLGAGGAGADLDAALAAADPPASSAERGLVTIDGRALLIYTSGTTGLPKAANVSHRRILSWGGWFAGLTDASVDDRLYDCLPLHHSVGCRRALQHASRGRFGRDRGEILRNELLGRHRAFRLHRLPIYRRALPLPAERAGVRR